MSVWAYGDDVNTDQLFPGKYTYTCSTPPEIIPHLLEDLDPMFAPNARAGDIIIGGWNFGCGSSREQPVLGLKALGIKAVIAKSFARIFFRAAINQGLILIECPSAVDAYGPGKELYLDLDRAVVRVSGEEHRFPGLPKEIIAISESGGLLEHTRARLRSRAG